MNGFARRMMGLPLTCMVAVCHVLSADLMTELDKDWGDGQRARADNRNHDGQRLRGIMDLAGTAVATAATNIMMLASLPDQAMGSKLSDRTPSPPAPPEPANPKATA